MNSAYIAPFYFEPTGTEANTAAPMLAGSLTNFKVVLSAAPGTSGANPDRWIIEIRVNNGAPPASATCTITNTETSCTIAGPIVFANADRLSIQAVEATGTGIGGNNNATRFAFKADYTFAP